MLASPPQRVADLRLRSSDGPMRTRVWWPLSHHAGVPVGLLLFFVDAAMGEQDWLRELATEAQVVVVAAPCAQDPDAIVGLRLRDGMLHIWTSYQDRAVLSLNAAAPNFYPGLIVLEGLIRAWSHRHRPTAV